MPRQREKTPPLFLTQDVRIPGKAARSLLESGTNPFPYFHKWVMKAHCFLSVSQEHQRRRTMCTGLQRPRQRVSTWIRGWRATQRKLDPEAGLRAVQQGAALPAVQPGPAHGSGRTGPSFRGRERESLPPPCGASGLLGIQLPPLLDDPRTEITTLPSYYKKLNTIQTHDY